MGKQAILEKQDGSKSPLFYHFLKQTIMTTVRFLIAFFVLMAQPIFCQPDETLPVTTQKPTANVVNGIDRFKNTDFMLKISSLRGQIEEEARDFISHRNRYKSQDVRKIQLAYGRTAARFNQVMLDIKLDFMDKDKIKMIGKYPQMYSDGLTSKINSLDQFYNEEFQQPLSLITEKDGSAILGILIELIKATGELSSYFKNIKFEKQAMSEDYINKNLIVPMRFTTWQELVNSTPISNDEPLNHGNNAGNGNNNGNGGNTDTGNGGNSGNGNSGNGGNTDTGNGGNSGNGNNGNGGNTDNGDNGNGGNTNTGNNGNGGNTEIGDNGGNTGNGGNTDNGNGGINPTAKGNKRKKPNVEQNGEQPVLELDDNSAVQPNQKTELKKNVKNSTTKKKPQE
jgi:hypothetical protein